MHCCARLFRAVLRVRSAPGKRAVLLETVHPNSAADQARVELAAEILDDLRRVDAQLRELHKRQTAVVLASKTSVTSIVGVGSIVGVSDGLCKRVLR